MNNPSARGPEYADPYTMVDFTKVSWSRRDFTGIAEKLKNEPLTLKKFWFLYAGFIVSWLCGFLAIFPGTAVGNPLSGIAALALIVLAPVYLGVGTILSFTKTPFKIIAPVLTASLISALIYGLSAMNFSGFMFVRIAISLVLMFGSAVLVGKARRSYRGYKQQKTLTQYHPIPEQEFLSTNTWGDVGQVEGAKHFSARNKELGVQGEKNTAELMNYLLSIPGTKVFHCLQFPAANTEADVDHAVVNGNKIALIDSKMYQGAHYSWTENGKVKKTKTSADGKKKSNNNTTHFTFATEELRDNHFLPAETRAWMTIYSNDGNPVTVNNKNATSVRLCTPHQMIEEIGAWFLKGQKDIGTVDYHVVRAVHSRLK